MVLNIKENINKLRYPDYFYPDNDFSLHLVHYQSVCASHRNNLSDSSTLAFLIQSEPILRPKLQVIYPEWETLGVQALVVVCVASGE